MSIFLTKFLKNVLPVLGLIGKPLLPHVRWIISIVSGDLSRVIANNSFATYYICRVRCNICSATWQKYPVT
jgi:hypothetical protein